MVSRLDGYVGRVLALLKELRLEENNSFRDNCFSNTGPFRGNKGNLYEGGIRVPAPRVSSFPWAFQDVLPSLLGRAQPPPI